MRRIMVVGCSGAGKSTFSRRLGAALGLPVTHLDRLYWRPGWTPAPDVEFHAAQEKILASDSWVIDGNYGASMHLRLPRADTIVFLDYPRRVCLRRVLVRCLREYGQDKQAPGCPEHFDREFYSYVWRWPKDHRERTARRLAEQGAHARRIVLTRPRDAEEFLRRIG
ncbi:Adenylate kinase [Amycolatopsis lurida]|uniref:DNA topology modulation protein FlaR n=1 Tax=Amycolatopsis lurida NRRL 2430 TaxID=1460371 RepID=A0A2P2FQQ6_AMYLU|nr:DNA topology modulation protein FlaR [Amycolatopsis lurida]KFU79039.1 DNA topology modulation protein FlaR [Amycolatopsis lurida NRRL 2430]SED74047.1 Adenylate kinase [Amycolatopsis lurida]